MSDPMPLKPHDFIVRLDGLPLDEPTRQRIAGAIQAAVLSELGKLDLAGAKPAAGLAYLPHRWWGIWYRVRADVLENLGGLGKTLGVTAGESH